MASPDRHLPSPTLLPMAGDGTIKWVLDTLFEPSEELHALAVPTIRSAESIGSYEHLIKNIGSLMLKLAESTTPDARAKLHGILGSHPRLGEKKVESAQSRAEQAHLNTADDSREKELEAAKLKELNGEYEARFPGLRYVVFVNGRRRAVVMQNMRERIDRGDIRAEEREAIQAMVDIALDRAKKMKPLI
ncbi:Oxo-4-hydroxy-4-carboxy-5-ureidoimidazoline decarboxylase [Hypoxylon sp. FL0890]|nr:Oxo-4-hydroxy-4-carboxy-5-ureidoimidazoline decarboxylase [Hypoxylon sp. FL0890]